MKYLQIILITIILIAFPKVSLAVNASIEITNDGINPREVKVSGQSVPDSQIFIKVVDMDGNIIFLDSVYTDIDGNYNCIFKIPYTKTTSFKVIVGNGAQVTEQEITVNTTEKNDISNSKDSNTKSKHKAPSAILLIEGKKQALDTVSTINENEEVISTIHIDSAVLISKMKNVIEENVIEVHVLDSDIDKAICIFKGDIIQQLAQKKHTIAVITGNVEYRIPAEEIRIEQLAHKLGTDLNSIEDIEVNIQLSKISEEQTREIIEDVQALGYEVIVQPVEFEIKAITTESGEIREVEVSKFSNYVPRIFKIPNDIDLSEIDTGVVLNSDGSLAHIPTVLFEKDGSWYARLNSLTNSCYFVIRNLIKIDTVEAHWSKEYVNDMAARLIIKDLEEFIPDKAITRGEFAEYIVKALGLFITDYNWKHKFIDVDKLSELAAVINIAAEYSIINGYSDGTFKSDRVITREEAMVMYARAMDIVDLKELDNNRILSYNDCPDISAWALSSVKKTLSVGVFNGRTNDKIDPRSTLTYAEAVTAIRNLLIEAGLINSREINNY